MKPENKKDNPVKKMSSFDLTLIKKTFYFQFVFITFFHVEHDTKVED